MAEQEPSHTLAQFVAATGERDRPGDVFELEGASMLEVHVRGRIWSKLGAMVAYRGQLKFVREGAFEGGLGRFVSKMVSGEAAPLTKIEGTGIAYLADQRKNVTVLRLQGGESINVNGNDLLAFEDTVRYDITMHRRVAGMLAGGLFSLKLSGSGMVAIMSHGAPLTLRCTHQDPIVSDPNATVAWSGNLSPQIKTDISLRSLIGRGGGEAFQMRFEGDGFVVVQPYEEVAVSAGR
ncbi:MAG TPA: AIM24 family protein [Vicinamibacteria bacterium]|nr:AIM24 family protein [Vicinamibacteria bacterium]